jgi:hypothetical protein
LPVTCLKGALYPYLWGVLSVIGVYRPSGQSAAAFNDSFFFQLLDVETITNRIAIVAGDFNIDLGAAEKPASTDLFIQNFSQLHFVPLIALPTRVGPNQASTIDHNWYSDMVDCPSGVIKTNITDHYAVFAIIPCDTSGQGNVTS